jgi:hypothetical protein
MTEHVDLTSENFLIYAAKWYDTVNCVVSELDADLKRIKYLKRLFRKYKITGEIRERLALNHIIILTNVFGTQNAVKMLFFKIDEKDRDVLKTFLVFLGVMPDRVYGVNGKIIESIDIDIDMRIAQLVRKI